MVLLVLAAFLAAFVDAIVGGGGAITLPALLATGMPPHLALGTNKLAATGASLTASVNYARAGLLDWHRVRAWMPWTLAGSLVGAVTVLKVPGDLIRGLVLVVMVAMTVYVLLRPRFGTHGVPRIGHGPILWGAVLALSIGFYDGFLGPGTGSLLLFGLVATQAYAFLPAAAHGRILNLGSNAAALALFAWAGEVDWSLGLPMVPAMVLGAWAGSKVGIRHGARFIRPLFVAVTLVLMARLVWGLATVAP